jgi:hypothetical protein
VQEIAPFHFCGIVAATAWSFTDDQHFLELMDRIVKSHHLVRQATLLTLDLR